MECSIGITLNDCVIIATDKTLHQSIMVLNHDEEKIMNLSEHTILSVLGEPGDTKQFSEYIAKNIQLYKMRNGYELSPSGAAHFTRTNLADALRSSSPYNINLFLGGYNILEKKPELYYMDYLASMIKIPYAAQGYGGFLCLSILDDGFKSDLTVEQGYELLVKCVKEIHRRFILNVPNFQVKMVNKDGIKSLPNISIKGQL